MQPRWTKARSLFPLAVLAAACGSPAPPAPSSILDVEDSSLTFFATPGGEDPGEEIDTVSDDGDGTLAEPTTSVAYGSGTGWLNVSVSGSKAPYVISVKPSVGSLPVGDYTASINVECPGAVNSPQTVAVTMKVSSRPVRTLSGVVSYEKVVPYHPDATRRGLDYANPRWEKVRGVEVELIDANTDRVIERSRTDGSGAYKFAWDTGQTLVKVRVRAQSVKPRIRVQDNTRVDETRSPPLVALYVGVSDPFDASKGSTLDLKFGSGWDPAAQKYATPRSAAPFAVLDAAYAATEKFLADRSAIAFPDLRINWSVRNRGEGNFTDEDYKSGKIHTSHWSPSKKELFILGLENSDTDEYDSHIIVHEWGHYFEGVVSRSDSPGSNHDFNQRKDPRLAWGEGWATALGGIIFHPNTFYVDTNGSSQAESGPFFDIERNEDKDDKNPGWFSEGSVLHVFYDLWDPPRNPDVESSFDQVQFTLGDLYDVMADEQKSTPAFTTVFSFIDGLKRRKAKQAGDIDRLLAHRGVVKVPITDRYGTYETNGGGIASVALPVYRKLQVDSQSTPLNFIGVGTDPAKEFFANELETCRLAYFEGTGEILHLAITTTGATIRANILQGGTNLGWNAGALPGDKYDEGDRKGQDKPFARSACVRMQTERGTIYRVVVVSMDRKPTVAGTPFTGTVTLSPDRDCADP